MRRFAWLIVLVLALAAPAAAQAGVVNVGSSLTQRAALTESHPRDWASWPTAFGTGGGNGVTVTETGEVTTVQFKGTVLKPSNPAYTRYPPFDFMVSILRPQADGSVRVVQTTTGQPFPFGGDDQQITTFDFASQNYNMCVQPGDVVSLITSGGFGTQGPGFGDASGMPDDYFADGYKVQMFGREGTSALIESSRGDGFFGQDNIGRPGSRNGELLMRATVGTNNDASFVCRSDAQNQNPTVQFPQQAKELPATGGKIAVQVRCASVRPCTGTLYARLSGNVVGTGPYSLGGGDSAPVAITLSDNGQRKLRESGGRMPITVQAKVSGGAQVEEGGFTVIGTDSSGPGKPLIATPVKPSGNLPVKAGTIALQVRCTGSAACTGKLAISKTGTFFGSARFSVPAGSARLVAVKLNAAAKSALRKATGRTISAKAVAKTASAEKSVIFKIKRA